MSPRPAPLLQRPAPFRSAALFVIAVEGEKTEAWYFNGLLDRGHVQRPQRVKLEILASLDGDSAPKRLVERLAARTRQITLRSFDQCWLVFDSDRWPKKQVAGALSDAAAERWSCAISNPCFETWLQLHHTERPEGERPWAAKRAWGALRDASEDPEWPFTTEQIRDAVGRASAADSGADWPDESPSSQVHRLVSQLLSA